MQPSPSLFCFYFQRDAVLCSDREDGSRHLLYAATRPSHSVQSLAPLLRYPLPGEFTSCTECGYEERGEGLCDNTHRQHRPGSLTHGAQRSLGDEARVPDKPTRSHAPVLVRRPPEEALLPASRRHVARASTAAVPAQGLQREPSTAAHRAPAPA